MVKSYSEEVKEVRNDETDIHNATNGWYEVDRATGLVKDLLYDD